MKEGMIKKKTTQNNRQTELKENKITKYGTNE